MRRVLVGRQTHLELVHHGLLLGQSLCPDGVIDAVGGVLEPGGRGSGAERGASRRQGRHTTLYVSLVATLGAPEWARVTDRRIGRIGCVVSSGCVWLGGVQFQWRVASVERSMCSGGGVVGGGRSECVLGRLVG